MRKLAIACASAAAAIFLSFYCLPQSTILPLTGACVLTGCLLLWKGDRAHRSLCVFLLILPGAALGFASYALHWNATIRRAAE